MSNPRITIDTRDSVTVVRLSHGKVNAFDIELMEDWISALDTLEHDGSRAAVVTAAGSVFSAGVDLRRLSEGGVDYVRAFTPLLGKAFVKTFSFPKPLIAAVNGHAIAGGCILACACDYRIMADGSGRIGTPELAVGVPFPSIALEILRLTVPAHRLQALIYGGLTCTPDEALTSGFVDEVTSAGELLGRALAVAGRLGAQPPVSFTLTKRLVRHPSLQRVEAARAIDDEVLAAWASPEVLGAVQAYVERTLMPSSS